MKQFLLFSLILLTAQYAYAQDWPAPNSEWSYCVDGFGGPYGSQTYIYSRDSTINNNTYAMVRPKHDFFSEVPYTDQDAFENDNMTFLRQSNDTIYRRVDTTEYVFFINGLNVGDTFTTYRSGAFTTNLFWCTPDLELEVIEISTLVINGTEYRRVSLEDIAISDILGNNILTPIYHYIEKIGLENNFPYFDFALIPDGEGFGSSCDITIDGPGGEFLFTYLNDAENLELFQCVPSGINDYAAVQLSVAPNPAFDVLHISSSNTDLKSGIIFNAIGQKVVTFSIVNSEVQLDVEWLTSGIYFVQIELESGSSVTKKFLKK